MLNLGRRNPLMISQTEIRIADSGDVGHIAEMSRDMIEHGLGWRWTPERIQKNLHDKDTNVIVACDSQRLAGFSIMKYRHDEAHLFLLAVHGSYRRKGVGTALMAWLEQTALIAGIGVIYLEARMINREARSFYQKLGYREIRKIRGYYLGREDAVQLAKDLWG